MASIHDAAAMSEDKQAEELLSESGSEDSDAAEGSEEEVSPSSAAQRLESPLEAGTCPWGHAKGRESGPAAPTAAKSAAPVCFAAGRLLDLLVLQPERQRVLLRGAARLASRPWPLRAACRTVPLRMQRPSANSSLALVWLADCVLSFNGPACVAAGGRGLHPGRLQPEWPVVAGSHLHVSEGANGREGKAVALLPQDEQQGVA